MTTTAMVVGVLGAALLFGVFTLLRPRDRGGSCTGNCAGCTRDGSCAKRAEGAQP